MPSTVTDRLRGLTTSVAETVTLLGTEITLGAVMVIASVPGVMTLDVELVESKTKKRSKLLLSVLPVDTYTSVPRTKSRVPSASLDRDQEDESTM